MSTPAFDDTELNSLAVRLEGAGSRAVPRTNIVVRKTAMDIEANAKQIAPVDTGNLKNSISHTIGGDSTGIEAVIGPTAAYGVHLEFGTSRIAPRAFMGPSLDRYSGAFAAAMEQIAAEEAL